MLIAYSLIVCMASDLDMKGEAAWADTELTAEIEGEHAQAFGFWIHVETTSGEDSGQNFKGDDEVSKPLGGIHSALIYWILLLELLNQCVRKEE